MRKLLGLLVVLSSAGAAPLYAQHDPEPTTSPTPQPASTTGSQPDLPSAQPKSPIDSLPLAVFDADVAIAKGLKKKRGGLALEDTLAAFGALSGEGVSGFRVLVDSPATWVQSRAFDAAEKFMTFTRADLTPEDQKAVLRVTVYPSMPRQMKDAGYASSVKHIVIRDAQKKVAIQPLAIETFEDSASNAFGATVTQRGARAIFDLAEVDRLRQMDPKGEFHITVVGDKADKTFKVKDKHFDDLGWSKATAARSN